MLVLSCMHAGQEGAFRELERSLVAGERTNPWPERKVSRVSGVSSVLWAVFGFHPGLQRELSHALCRVLGGASCGFCP